MLKRIGVNREDFPFENIWGKYSNAIGQIELDFGVKGRVAPQKEHLANKL